MARYARIFSSIWSDPDFTARTANAQRLYLLLVTQPDVSHCGVLPYTERRWARLALDTDADSVRAALTELVDNRFIVTDEHTEEILVRSYIKWDGQLTSPNGWKAVEKARSQVLSRPLAGLIADLMKAPPEGACQGATEGDASPQQPAASSHSQQPRSSSRGPGDPSDDQPSDATSTAAAAYREAIRLALEHRRSQTPGIRNHAGWEKTTRPGIEAEHGARFAALIAEGHTAAEAVRIVYRLSETVPAGPTFTEQQVAVKVGNALIDRQPEAIYAELASDYPTWEAEIAAELHARTGWTPPTATVTPIRGAK